MTDVDLLKSIIKEAETYRTQGLLDEAKEKYHGVLSFIKNHEIYSKRNSLVESIDNKIKAIENEIVEIEEDDDIPDLSQEVQDLIGRLFSTSKNKDIASVESAVALAKFGQYEKALEEFETLSKRGIEINADTDINEVVRHFNVMIKDLRDSYTDIKGQSVQLMRYAKDLAKSYKKIKAEEDLRDKLSRYVGRNLLDKLLDSEEGVFFENERKEVTLLFADIRGFTAMSERMPAEDVVSMLNEYFTAMVDVIFRNNGVLDKFVGDGLMAVFGLLTSDNVAHYHNAVKAAVEMQGVAEKLMNVRTMLRKQTFDIGIGINTGVAIVGNVGSINRMDYTVIGDCVNTASRLQEVSKGGEIIIGESTYKVVKDLFSIQHQGKIKLKNKKQPVKYYKVVR